MSNLGQLTSWERPIPSTNEASCILYGTWFPVELAIYRWYYRASAPFLYGISRDLYHCKSLYPQVVQAATAAVSIASMTSSIYMNLSPWYRCALQRLYLMHQRAILYAVICYTQLSVLQSADLP